MDINRRDFTKFLGALGAGAMVSPSVLHAALPSTKTVVAAKPLITSIGMSTVFNMQEIGELASWSEAEEGYVETVVDYSLENGDSYTLTFSGGEKIWCEEHDASISEPTVTCTAVSYDGESTTTTEVGLNVYADEVATPITELEIGQHYDLDLIILVINKPGQHAWNHIIQNNSYRVLVKNTELVSKILERGGNENDI